MAVAARTVPIIVLAGQSNANSVGIGQAVFNEVTAQHGLYVHVAVNGTSIAPVLDTGGGDWSASGAPGSGELLNSLMAQIKAMTDPASPTYVPGAYLKKVVWVQGEADTWYSGAANGYQTALKAVHTKLTQAFGTYDLVISALSDASINSKATTDAHRVNWATIQRAQIALAASDPTIFLVDPDTVAAKGGYSVQQMLVSDFLHYNTATGYAGALGRALVQEGSGVLSAPGTGGTGITPHYAVGTQNSDFLRVAAIGVGQAYGSAGFDTLTLTDRTTGVKLAGGGLDALRVTANGGAAFYLDLVSIESVVLTAGADKVMMASSLTRVDAGGGGDWINGLGNADTILLGTGNDMGHGGAGHDSIYGGDGLDLMYGSDGNDMLDGGSSSDKLFGGTGTDRVLGGSGNDMLSGGTDRDVFIFAPGGGTDHITDFENGIDRVELHGTNRSLSITASGADTMVRWGDVTIIFDGVSSSLITAADFYFT